MTEDLPFLNSPYSISGTLRNLESIPKHLRQMAIWRVTEPMRAIWDADYYNTDEGYALLAGAYFRYESAIQLAKQGKRMVNNG